MRVVPSGGYHFPSDGKLDSQAPLHYEAGYEEIVNWLRGFRIANGHPLGAPQQDVDLYILRSNPRQSGNVPEAPAYQPTTVVPKNFRERVTNFLASTFASAESGAIQYVQEEESEERAQTCVDCPHNQSWKTGCPPCVENAERVVLMITQGKRTSLDKRLEGCDICGHSNQVAVVLNESHLKHREHFLESLPDFCWLNKMEKT